MKHYSANIEEGIIVDSGHLTLTAGDSIISQNIDKTGNDRAIILGFADTEFVDGTGAVVSNDAFNGVSYDARRQY